MNVRKSLLYVMSVGIVVLLSVGYLTIIGNPFCTANTTSSTSVYEGTTSRLPAVQGSLVSLEQEKESKSSMASAQVAWLPLEEAIKRARKAPKKILIDLYTDWCGWCKVMDRDTYSKEEVIRYLHENYYPVKFNAEQRKDVQFLGRTFKYVATSNTQGYHQLAHALTEGNLSYPTTVLLDEKQQPITYVPGFLNAKNLSLLMKFVAEDKYENMSYTEYKKKNQ